MRQRVNKVKCTLVQAQGLCTGRTAQRGSRGITLLFLDHGTRRGEGSASRPAALYAGKDPVPIVRETGWAPGPVWTGAENLASHRDSIPGPSSPQPVAITTELPAHNLLNKVFFNLWTRMYVAQFVDCMSMLHLRNTRQQQNRWTVPEAVVTVKCS